MMPHRLRRAPLAALFVLLLWPAQAALAQGFGGTVADHLVRGDSLLAQGKAAEGIVQFQEARTLCPTPDEIVSALDGEARGRLMQHEILPAVGLLEEAATRFPDDPRTSNLLYQAGVASQGAGEYDKAVELYRKALTRNPTGDILPPLKVQLAYSLRMRGKAAEAIDVLKDFDKDYPDHVLDSTALYQIAIAQHDLGTPGPDRARLESSAATFKRLIEKFPGRPAAIEAHFELGLVLQELGRKAEAADYFNKFASLNPASPFVPSALERAGDLMLFRSPRQSAQFYALAQVKAKAIKKPAGPTWDLSPWLPAKQRLAGALSSVWVLAIAGIVTIGILALVGRIVVRRLRRAPAAA